MQFRHVHTRLQGDGAAVEIRLELLGALERLGPEGIDLNAVAIIRGGIAIKDMAWLNDYALVRAACEMKLPVLTSFGHER